MKVIWLVNPYGPIEGENWREYSFNQFGKYLSSQGFKVIWWTASFSHHFKKQRSQGWKDIEVNKNFKIRLVPTTSYKKNFGIGRLWKDLVFSKNAVDKFKKEKNPDIIIANENPMTMGFPAFFYAKKNNVPIIYDQMDIWPEFFVGVLKEPLKTIAKIILKPIYLRRRQIYKELDGSIALGKHYLEFMQKIAPILREKPNALVYNGIDVCEFRKYLLGETEHSKLKIEKKDGEIWCVFAGTLGPSYDIKTIIKTAEKFSKEGKENFKFIIAGSGPFEGDILNAEKKLNNIIYVGKLLPEQLIPIYGKCDIGLATYSAGSNVDMCDKFYDYLASGLAVINSLTGEISEHIFNNNLGVNYLAGDMEDFIKALLRLEDFNILTKIKKNSMDMGMLFDKNIQNEKLLKVINSVLNVKKI